MKQASGYVLLLVFFLTQCAYILIEDEYRKGDFIPVREDSLEGGLLRIEEEEYVWEREGLVLHVEHLNDEQLNSLFPEQADRGKYSTNPYTYSNWVSPDFDITPDRFTVFRLDLHNITYPVVQLQPLKCRLIDDKRGVYFPYSLERSELTPNDLTSYFLKLRGPTGNDRIRYDDRIGNAKSTLFSGNKIYKGETQEGLLVFDPVPSSVENITLELKDFILEFDANNWPSKSIDLTLHFRRRPETAVRRDTTKTALLAVATGQDTVVKPGKVIIEPQYLSGEPSDIVFENGVLIVDGPVGAKVWLATPVTGNLQKNTLSVYSRPGGNRVTGNQIRGTFKDKERIKILRSFRVDEVSYYHFAESETGELKGWIDWRYVLFDPVEQ